MNRRENQTALVALIENHAEPVPAWDRPFVDACSLDLDLHADHELPERTETRLREILHRLDEAEEGKVRR